MGLRYPDNRKLKIAGRLVIAAVLLSCLLMGGLAANIYIFGNFHEITPGQAYRSAQLDSQQLEYYIQKYNIKSILNLRGENAGNQWYRDEISVSARLKVRHYDIALSASKEPEKIDVDKITDFLKNAPRPVLIHCMAGADRSGLVSAMWRVAVDKASKEEAAGQLSIIYGHLPAGKTTAMDRFFEKWRPD